MANVHRKKYKYQHTSKRQKKNQLKMKNKAQKTIDKANTQQQQQQNRQKSLFFTDLSKDDAPGAGPQKAKN